MNTWQELYERFPRHVLKPNVVFHHKRGSLVCMREMSLPKKGNVAVTHKHQHGHYSWLASGRARVIQDGRIEDYTAPAILWIKPDVHHSIEALTDNVMWICVHPVPPDLADSDDLGPDQMDEVLVK